MVTQRAAALQLTFLAAAVAYYALVSTIPLLALVLVITGTVGGENAIETLIARTSEVLTPETQELLTDALAGGTSRASTTIIGGIFIAWSALRAFRGIDKAFARIYQTPERKSRLTELREGILVIAAIGLAGGSMTIIGMGLRLVTPGPLVGFLGTVLVVMTLIAVLFPLYYVFPAGTLTLREALPGTVFAAVGWALLWVGFRVYLAIAQGLVLYGILGGILLFVTVLYAAGLILMLGATVNVVVADRQLQQEGP